MTTTRHRATVLTMKLLTLAQMAEETGYEQSWLRRQCEQGKLRAQKLGKTWLVTPSAVARFMSAPTRRKD